MFGRNREQSQRRHSQPERTGADFDMASYRRGTTLNSFKSEEPTQSERKRLKRLRAIRRRMAAVLAVIIVLLILGLSLLSQFAGNITKVVTSDGIELQQADVDRYSKIVNDYFAENSFERFSFARRNSALLQYVEGQAPEVADVKVVPSGLASGRIELTLRQPVAMWINGDKTSFVDSNGIVFERNYYAVPAIAIEDNSGVSVDGMATSSSFLSFVGRVATTLQDKEGLKVARVVIPQGSARYVEIYLDGRNYPFKAQITRDSGSQAHDIAVMARYVDTHGLQPQYIDCRVEGKAYWK